MGKIALLSVIEVRDDMIAAVSNELLRMKINTAYLKWLRRAMGTKQEATLLAQQIRKNENDLVELERNLEWLKTFDGTFQSEPSEPAAS